MTNEVQIETEIYTHEYLWRSSTYLVARTEDDDADWRQLIPALLMTFLAFEAFVNFIGHAVAPELWAEEKKNFRRKGLEGKLTAIVEKLPSFHWEKGKPPYQSVKDLEAFRDMVSHGKVIASSYAAERKKDGTHFRFHHPWDEYLSVDYVKNARNNVEAFSNMLLKAARRVSGDPYFMFDAYEGELGLGVNLSEGGESFAIVRRHSAKRTTGH